jgi:hypothetical protein
VAQAALRRANDRFAGSPQAVRERMRAVAWHKPVADAD